MEKGVGLLIRRSFLTEDRGLYSNRFEQLVSAMRIASENRLERTAKFFTFRKLGSTVARMDSGALRFDR